MVAEITFKNFFSFRDEATFSFEADNDTALQEFHVVEVKPDVRLLKLGIIYGANASGKSNVLKVWEFFQDFFDSSRIVERNDPIRYTPFKLDEESGKQPSEFAITFYIKNQSDQYIKYNYSLVLSGNIVTSETLQAYFSAQPTAIFERVYKHGISEIKFSTTLKVSATVREEIKIKCLPNISMFSAYRRVNTNIPVMEEVNNYLHNKLSLPLITQTGLFPQYIDINSKHQKENILQFIKEADFNISDIQRNEKAETPFDKAYYYTHKIVDKLNNFVYYNFPEDMESAGTIQAFRLSGYIYEVLKNKGFIAIDEIESSLHPKLVEFLLVKFLKESETEQLLFTTHYDGLLAEEDLIRKDNIWFTAKNKEGVSELYPLTDFKGLNRLSSLQKAYKLGKFGAIPTI
jgi:AAA15 family ATPase/GTPase